MLTQIAGAVVLGGAVVLVCAWFAGPSRFATPARRWLAPHVRRDPVGTYGVVAAVLLLIFIWQPIPATGKPVGMVVFAVLAAAGTEALRRQTAAEFPPTELAGAGPSVSAPRRPRPDTEAATADDVVMPPTGPRAESSEPGPGSRQRQVGSAARSGSAASSRDADSGHRRVNRVTAPGGWPPVLGADDAADADMGGGGVDRLRLPCRRAIAQAVVGGAQVRAALDHLPGNPLAGSVAVRL